MYFFPRPLPDELLFSVLARYHAYSGNESHKNSVRDLFGSKTICAVVDLPCNLLILSAGIPGGAISADELLYQNTLFSYYSPFLPHDRYQLVKKEMLHCVGSSLHMKMGLTANGVKNNNMLKYCPMCVKQDREVHGVAYWHRAHQLPGVSVCHKHSVILIDSRIPFASRRNKHEFHTLEKAATDDHEVAGDERSIQFACSSFNLLHAGYDPFGLDSIKGVYMSRLQEMGLVYWSGRLKSQQIVSQFTQFYGEDFLRQKGSFISEDEEDSWLHKVLRNEGYTIHPLRHLLLLGYLDLPLASLVVSNLDSISPLFGHGPWPCLNKAADHYKQDYIAECKVTRCSVTGKPVGTFSCECGFVYSRRGPDINGENRFKIGKIKAFGEVWEKRLQVLNVEGGSSLREMARLLGVDPRTVKNQLNKSSTGKGEIIKVDFSRKQEKVLQNRREWLKLLAQPGASNLSKTRLYAWLYKNDKDWLLKNPPVSRRGERRSRVDWELRDNQIVEEVRQIAEEIFPHNKIRISKSEIGRRIGKLSLLNNQIDKMPETQGFLREIVESTRSFQIRRIRLTRREYGNLSDWRVARLSGMDRATYIDVTFGSYSRSIEKAR